MGYIENPKTRGSGIVAAIPQTGICPNQCEDCFFQSGRSYLEPLSAHLPNLPDPTWVNQNGLIVRVNDGNDSNVQRELVIASTSQYDHRFFNTSIPQLDFPAPVVLTVNPGRKTDVSWHRLEHIPKNLMFVRIRTNTWNLDSVVDPAVQYYTTHPERGVPVVLTFMAYFRTEDEMPPEHRKHYVFRRRTTNDYMAITTEAWREIMKRYQDNGLVYSCGKIEGEKGDTHCLRCGNCVREYHNTRERMRE